MFFCAAPELLGTSHRGSKNGCWISTVLAIHKIWFPLERAMLRTRTLNKGALLSEPRHNFSRAKARPRRPGGIQSLPNDTRLSSQRPRAKEIPCYADRQIVHVYAAHDQRPLKGARELPSKDQIMAFARSIGSGGIRPPQSHR
jgi:hypothetical protein